MTAAAQPTPDATWIALAGQLSAHAPQAMHRSADAMQAVLPVLCDVVAPRVSANANTLCGQTSMQVPHPVHLFVSSSSDSPFRG